jgi:class 3 adenylate cyclase
MAVADQTYQLGADVSDESIVAEINDTDSMSSIEPHSSVTIPCTDHHNVAFGGHHGDSLRKWVWYRLLCYFMIGLIPLSITCIVAVSVTSPLLSEQIANNIQTIVDRSLLTTAMSVSNNLRSILTPIEEATMMLCDLTRYALKTPRIPPSYEMNSYGQVPTCDVNVFATLYDYGGSDAYVAQYIVCDSQTTQIECNRTITPDEIERYFWRTGYLDEYLMSSVERLDVTQSYVNFVDGTLRIYPTRVQLTGVPIGDLFGCTSDIRDYEFWYGADYQHDPQGKAVWTSAYVDPGFSGWVASCIGPVYQLNQSTEIEAVGGFDVSLSIMMKKVGDIDVPWNGYVVVLDRDGVILSLPPAGLLDWGLQELENYTYEDFIVSPTFKPDQFNIFKRNDTIELAQAISATPFSGTVLFQLNGLKLAAWNQVPETNWTSLTIASADLALADQQRQKNMSYGYIGFIIGITCLLVLTIIGIIFFVGNRISYKISTDIGRVYQNVTDITEKKYDVNDMASGIREIDNTLRSVVTLAKRLDHMVVRYERLVNTANKFVPDWMIKMAGFPSYEKAKLGVARNICITVAFIDIRNFTTLTEGTSHKHIMRFLNAYASLVSPIIRTHEGTIDKYIGDGILVLFPSPEKAITAIDNIYKMLSTTEFTIPNKAPFKVQIGVGVDHGNVVIGTVGDESRMDVTVISDVVNVASRLEGLTSRTGTRILTTYKVIMNTKFAGLDFSARSIGILIPKGKKIPVDVWEIVVDNDPIRAIKLNLHKRRSFDNTNSIPPSTTINPREEMMKSFSNHDLMKCLNELINCAQQDNQHVIDLIEDSHNLRQRVFEYTITESIDNQGKDLYELMTYNYGSVNNGLNDVNKYYDHFIDILKNAISHLEAHSLTEETHVFLSHSIDNLNSMLPKCYFDGILMIYANKSLTYLKNGIPEGLQKSDKLPIAFEEK